MTNRADDLAAQLVEKVTYVTIENVPPVAGEGETFWHCEGHVEHPSHSPALVQRFGVTGRTLTEALENAMLEASLL